MSDRVSRYLAAVGNADPRHRTHAKVILTITLFKKDALGKVDRISFPSSEYDSWTHRTALDTTQAATLQSVLSWGQQLSDEDQELDAELAAIADAAAAAAAAAAADNATLAADNATLDEVSHTSGHTSPGTIQKPPRCVYADAADRSTRRSLSLKLPAAYPPLLFVENDGTVYPMDSRQHASAIRVAMPSISGCHSRQCCGAMVGAT